jgi:hypothetical protein
VTKLRTATARICAVSMGLALAQAVIASVAFAATPSQPSSAWQTVGNTTSEPPSGRVRAITVIGATAYFGGLFTEVRPPGSGTTGRVSRNHLAAINLNNGELRPWNPQANGTVWAMAADPAAHRVYVAGDFGQIGGVAETKIAAIDSRTGEVIRSFNPRVTGRVRAIEVGTDRIFIGGKFLAVQGQSQPLVAALSKSTGKLVTEWRPAIGQLPDPCPPRCTPEVASLALSLDGNSIYIGGHFGTVNGVNRNNVARVSIGDGENLLPWDPSVLVPVPTNPNQKNFVYDISVTPNRVYFCGDYFKVNYGWPSSPNGLPSANLSAVDPSTGERSSNWDTVVTNGGTPACQVSPDGATLFIGGHFTRIGMPGSLQFTRSHVASISTANGAPVTAWNPWANSKLGLHVVFPLPGSGVLIGGDFSKTGGGGSAQARFRQGIALFG